MFRPSAIDSSQLPAITGIDVDVHTGDRCPNCICLSSMKYTNEPSHLLQTVTVRPTDYAATVIANGHSMIQPLGLTSSELQGHNAVVHLRVRADKYSLDAHLSPISRRKDVALVSFCRQHFIHVSMMPADGSWCSEDVHNVTLQVAMQYLKDMGMICAQIFNRHDESGHKDQAMWMERMVAPQGLWTPCCAGQERLATQVPKASRHKAY